MMKGTVTNSAQATVAAVLAISLASINLRAVEVTYTMQSANFPTTFKSGGGLFSNGVAELGMWANSGSKQVVGWENFSTTGVDGGAARALQVGDQFTLTVSATRAYGQIGFSLNAGGTQGVSYANNINGSRLFIDTNNYGAWFVGGLSGGATSSLAYVPLQDTYKDYQFNIKITSLTTADVYLTVDGTSYRAYNLTLNGTAGANIDAFSIYGSDMWDGNSNDNAYWKQTSKLSNTETVELGYYATSGTTFTPGQITDGLAANSTSTTSVNAVLIGGVAGSQVNLSAANTYTGGTTINANATARLSNANGFGTTAGGVTVSNGGMLEISNNISVGSEALSLSGTGISSNGALRNISGNNTWGGSITLTAASRINSDSGTLTLTGGISGSGGNLTIGGAGNTVVSTTGITTGAGTLTKDGSGTLTLSAANTYTGDTYVRAGALDFTSTGSAANSAIRLGSASGSSVDASINLTTATGGTTISSLINTVATSGSGALSLNSQNSSGNNTITSAIYLDRALKVQQAAGGNLTFSTGTFDVKAQALTVDSAGTTTISQALTSSFGAGGYLVKEGAGKLILSNTANTYTGTSNNTLNASGTQIVAGTLGIYGDGSLGVAPAGAYNNIQFTGSSTLQDTSNDITLDSKRSISVASGVTASFDSNGNNFTVNGVINGSGGNVSKIGTGNVTFSGDNTYTGATTVTGGTLALAATSGQSALGGTTSVTVSTGGTLLLSQSNQIKDAATMALGGGTIKFGAAVSEGGNGTVGVDALTLTANSTLDFSSFGGGITFASFAPSAYILSIINWQPTSSHLIFNQDQSLKLSSFTVNGQSAFQTSLGGGFYEIGVSAVPEPSTWVAMVALVLAGGTMVLRRPSRKASARQAPCSEWR